MKLFSLIFFLSYSLLFYSQTSKNSAEIKINSAQLDIEDFDIVFAFYPIHSAEFPVGSYVLANEKNSYKTQVEYWLTNNQNYYLEMIDSTKTELFVFRRSEYYKFDTDKQLLFKEWFNKLDELMNFENKTGLIKPKRMVISTEDFNAISNFFNN